MTLVMIREKVPRAAPSRLYKSSFFFGGRYQGIFGDYNVGTE